MDNKRANTITVLLSAAGAVLILAGAFNIIEMRYALFLGAAAFIIGGVMRRI
ncbi:MAG TPA: hypothetical protein VE262_03780 [Blastocatellia bacterium]|nr:hypothetical protein [Blastocatellia bacterium]